MVMDHIYCIDTLQSPLQVSEGGLTEILRRRGRTDKIQDTLLRPDSHLNSTRLLTTGKKNISVSGVEKYFQVEHYKPGAFTGRRAGSEDARRPRSADSGDIALKA